MQRNISEQGGFALVTVMILLITLTVLSTAYFFTTNVETISVQAYTDSITGFYSAEAGLNIKGEKIRQEFEYEGGDEWPPTPSDESLDQEAYSYNNRDITTYVEDVEESSITISQGELFEGLSAKQYQYTVVSEAKPENSNRPEAILEMVFNSRLVPLFQFGAFYNKDLEIHSGFDTDSFNGRLHTSGDLHLDADDASPLNIDEHITVAHQDGAGGSLFRERKVDGTCADESVFVNDGENYRELECSVDQDTLDEWGGRIETGLGALSVLEADRLLDPGGLYWERADLVVALDMTDPDDPEIIVPDRENTLFDPLDTTAHTDMTDALNLGVCIDASDTCDPTDLEEGDSLREEIDDRHPAYPYNDNLLNELQDFEPSVEWYPVEASESFYDKREDQYMTMLEVDIPFLLARMHESTEDLSMDSLFSQGPNESASIDDDTDGGLVIYFTVVGDDPDEYGVRLRNGAELTTWEQVVSDAPEIQGLTVASDLPIYIQGNYNLNAPDDLSEDHDPEEGADEDEEPEYWRPAAIMGDTVNILSEGWSKDDNPEDVVPTRVNAAFLAGTYTTEGSDYSGGLENYPRLHEDWDGTDLFYQGSFVSLNTPQYASDTWEEEGSVYTAPDKNWKYDIRFNSESYLPPLTPRFVYLKQERFIRLFER